METQNKYLLLARRARDEDNAEDAQKYYDIVRTEDPDNAEAKFFYSYYRLFSGTNGEAVGNYLSMCKGVENTLKLIVTSNDTIEEKKILIRTIFDCIMDLYNDIYHKAAGDGRTNEVRTAHTKAITTIIETHTNNYGEDEHILEVTYKFKAEKLQVASAMYALGDEIENKYSSNTKLMAIAIDLWKRAIVNHQKTIYIADPYGKAKRDEEIAKYAAKIQKYDPTYVAPTPKEGFIDKLIKKITTLIGKK